MNIILFDTDIREALLPFTYIRPVCEIRLGVLTIREKWQIVFPGSVFSFITPEHLEPLYPIRIAEDNLLINGSIVPEPLLIQAIQKLKPGETLMCSGELIAARLSEESFEKLLVHKEPDALVGYELEPENLLQLNSLLNLTELAISQIGADMERLGLRHERLGNAEGDYPVYLHPDARVERAYINASEGPVYVGPYAHLMDGAKIRGPVAIGESTIVKGHALLIKGVCAGPHCELGGEIKGSIIMGYSNKSHEGYIGDSVIGEWCNLGALTTNSNLKNTFSNVQVFDYTTRTGKSSGRRKCGFFLGDYSRTAIFSQINSGTVIGVSSHLFGERAFSGFIPSFSWANGNVAEEYRLEKALEAISVFRSFKNQDTRPELLDLLTRVFELSSVYR